jgi:hypothetical protein
MDNRNQKWTLTCANFTGQYFLQKPTIIWVPEFCTFSSAYATLLPGITHDIATEIMTAEIKIFPMEPIEYHSQYLHSMVSNLTNMTAFDLDSMKWNISELHYGLEIADIFSGIHWPVSMSTIINISICLAIIIGICCCRKNIKKAFLSLKSNNQPTTVSRSRRYPCNDHLDNELLSEIESPVAGLSESKFPPPEYSAKDNEMREVREATNPLTMTNQATHHPQANSQILPQFHKPPSAPKRETNV